MNSSLLKIHWQNRPDALSPCAVVAFDGAAISLAEKLLSFEDEKLHFLQGISAEQMILLTGESENLPWTNGAIYLGRDAQMPSLLLPTTLKPSCPLDLFERALNEKFRSLSPFAVLPEKIIPFGAAKPLSRPVLENWLSENR
jgi:hypothetical protein